MGGVLTEIVFKGDRVIMKSSDPLPDISLLKWTLSVMKC